MPDYISVLSLWDAIYKNIWCNTIYNKDISKYKEEKNDKDDERIKNLYEKNPDLLYAQIKNDLENIMKNPDKNITSLVQQLKTKIKEKVKVLSEFDNLLSNKLIKLVKKIIDEYNVQIEEKNVAKNINDDLITEKNLKIDEEKITQLN